ncbi:MAG TPA: hypothetical protein VH083_21215 [Myxococcales bacterium]|jgi:hypothetical protein|nr:hypothetical protein [Myxococcales bacterium]
MTVFFCPYTGKYLDFDRSSLEHIVSGAMGGSRDFAIHVEKQANNVLGSEVDDQVANIYIHRRMKHDLRGHSGRAPRWVSAATLDALGGREARWELTLSDSILRVEPQVIKEQLPNGELRITVSGDRAEATRIFEEIRLAHEAKGKKVSPPVLTEQQIEQPKITVQSFYDMLAFGKFPVKVALGCGHWLWGENWSRGTAAEGLRRALWSKTKPEFDAAVGDKATALPAPAKLGIRVEDTEHGFFASRLPDRTSVLLIFPFGQQGWAVKLGQVPDPEPTMMVLDVKARTVRRLSVLGIASENRFRHEPS